MDTASNDELFDSKSCDEEEFTTLMLKYSGNTMFKLDTNAFGAITSVNLHGTPTRALSVDCCSCGIGNYLPSETFGFLLSSTH
ncbi:hypothetical protein L915_10368 [Phytophthora nicotianae]|uniref:Uncharacterized protein n=1 Tax=Phytophthora nicotianae TaxID=4792 RepID=W2GQU4_PHYNI|nr:hypothetical protein L915_10368 [Phytophthora nicotianae]